MSSSVDPTALLCAHVRALENNRPHPLVVDPLAFVLSGKQGEDIYQHFAGIMNNSSKGKGEKAKWWWRWKHTDTDDSKELQRMNDNIIVRTKHYDDFLESKLKWLHSTGHANKQVVLLGSGLDTRAFRLDFPPNTHVFELDTESVLKYKQERLQKHYYDLFHQALLPKCHKLSFIPADFSSWSCSTSSASSVHQPSTVTTSSPSIASNASLHNEWPAELLKNGFDVGAPTVWIAEGLFAYLSEKTVSDVITMCEMMSARGGSWLACEVPSEALLRMLKEGKVQLHQEMALYGHPFVFGMSDPKEFMRTCGWNQVEVLERGEEGINFGRIHHPIPKWIPFPARYWFIHAQK